MQPVPGLILIRLMGVPNFIDAVEYPEIFDNCCHVADAEALLKLFPAGCTLTNAVKQQPFLVMFLDPTLGWFQITGTDAAGMPIDEDAGDLLDRKVNPNGPMQDVANGLTIGFHDYPQESYCAAYWNTGTPVPLIGSPTVPNAETDPTQLAKVKTGGPLG